MQGSLPWPVQGLYRLNEVPEPPPLTLWTPGFPEWENKVLLAPRTLSVVTGHPGHGKTSLFMQIWAQVCGTYGLTAAIKSSIRVEEGKVKQANFHNFKLIGMDEAPAIEVYVVPSGEAPGGTGEPGTPPIAPAIANAIFAATGKRIRRLPITADDLK